MVAHERGQQPGELLAVGGRLETRHCGPAGHHAPEDRPSAIAEAITAWARTVL